MPASTRSSLSAVSLISRLMILLTSSFSTKWSVTLQSTIPQPLPFRATIPPKVKLVFAKILLFLDLGSGIVVVQIHLTMPLFLDFHIIPLTVAAMSQLHLTDPAIAVYLRKFKNHNSNLCAQWTLPSPTAAALTLPTQPPRLPASTAAVRAIVTMLPSHLCR